MPDRDRVEQMLPSRVRSLLQKQIRDAAHALRGRRAPSDESIHRARKRLKGARASLRLIREVIGDPAYRRENACLRDAARPLSRVRDGRVMLETLDGLLKKEPGRTALSPIRRVLQRDHSNARRTLLDPRRRGELIAMLEAAGARAGRWRFRRDSATALRGGIERLYRRGRKTLTQADSHRSEPTLHEARKGAKYLELALAPFVPAGGRRTAKLARRAEAVGDRLGKDHDLAVLRERIAPRLADAGDDGKALLDRIEKRGERLRAKALKQGRRLYKNKPERLLKRLEKALP